MERFHYRELERDQNPEARERLNNINFLLAKLIESGPELDPQVKARLRDHIRQYLGLLRLNGRGQEGAEGLLVLRQRLNIEVEHLPLPPKYPTIQEFQRSLLKVVMDDQEYELPEVPPVPKATGVAKFGQYDWLQIQGMRGQYTLDYLYDLGKVMNSRPAYEAFFPTEDAIVVADDWWLENGPQRGLVLRTLGAGFVNKKGMNDWVEVQKER